MRRAALGSVVFLLIAPGVTAGLIPWSLTDWDPEPAPVSVRVGGVILIALGVGFLLHAFARFVIEGLGTPAPVAPPARLVVGGVYGYVRNPMYLAVASIIVGQALFFGQPVLLAYAAAFGVVVLCFVRLYEEPTLAEQFGASYEEYRRAVPAWVPRRTPWRGP